MSKKKADKEPYASLFKEEVTNFLRFQEANGQVEGEGQPSPENAVPSYLRLELPETEPAPEARQKTYWRALRTFFRSGKKGRPALRKRKDKACPALLAPFMEKGLIQPSFPCWLAEGRPFLDSAFKGIRELLEQAVLEFAPAESQARILKDNLLRLEAAIRQKTTFAEGAFKAQPVFDEAIGELETQLSVKGPEGVSLSGDLKLLRQHLPSEGVLIAYSGSAPLHLLAALIKQQLAPWRRELQAEVAQLKKQLKEILAVEREKNPDTHSAENLHSELGFADSLLNFEELAAVLPTGSSKAMPAGRYQRIQKILSYLERARELLFQKEAAVVFAEGQDVASAIDWKNDFPHFQVHALASDSPVAAASGLFDQEMSSLGQLFVALRAGKLEVEGQYLPEVHDDFFAHFDWRHFSEKEFLACPPLLLIVESSALIDEEMPAFSRLLAAGRPVRVVAIRNSSAEPVREPVTPAAARLVFRQELGAIAIAHRNAFVLQSATIHPEYLCKGFSCGLRAFSPALFHLVVPWSGEGDLQQASLWSSAAVEGREFPGFIYDSEEGPKWGSRFDIQNNPQPEADWPEHTLSLESKGEATAARPSRFTFADFAVLDQRFASFFHIVPPAFWTGRLIPLADYLELAEEDAIAAVPFIWLVDEKGQLQRAAIAWPLVLACRERLDFWHYLQENAGVHSYHVEQATEKMEQKLKEEAEKRLQAQAEAHQEELKRVEAETARLTMDKLAGALLGMDVGNFEFGPAEEAVKEESISATAPTPREETREAPPAKKVPAAPEAADKEKPAEGTASAPEEAWIETPLCTSCNECIDTNDKLFQYNEDKQAFVADPKGGPFADIVKAAEKCPVKIIHPGTPQHKNEPQLEEWIKRASPYQA